MLEKKMDKMNDKIPKLYSARKTKVAMPYGTTQTNEHRLMIFQQSRLETRQPG